MKATERRVHHAAVTRHGHTYHWEAEAALWTAGCPCRTGSWGNRRRFPATWWTTDMLPNPEAESSGSRCCLNSTDQEPCLKEKTLWVYRPTGNILCVTLSYRSLPLLFFFLSVMGPHKTYTPAATAAAIPPMTPQFFIILLLKTQKYLTERC